MDIILENPVPRTKKVLAILIFAAMLVSSLSMGLLIKAKFETVSENVSNLGLATIQGNSILAMSNPAGPIKIRKVNMVITAYSSDPWQTDDTPFITASGSTVKDGIVANNLLPFGTKIRMPELYGNKIFVVEDRMNWRKSHYQLDVWFPEYNQAKNFGMKRTCVEILEI